MSDQFGVKDVVGAPVERTRLAEQSLVAIPPRSTRFTMHEWNLSNSLRCRNTEDQQQLADRILSECDRVRNETAERSSTLQLTSERRMAERAADVRFEADELRERRTELCLELGRLETYTSRCQTCLAALAENALNACRKCLMLRDGRIGIDLVVDNVEDALQREITTILGAQSLVRRALEQANEQMRRIRAARYSIDRNLHYKTIAVDTDEATMRMKHSDLGLCVYEGYSNLDPATISLEEWNLQSAKDIQQAAKEVTSARPIRVYIDTLLKQVVEDLWDSFDKCNKAFQDRITETKRAKAHLEDMHAETVIKVNDMQNNLVLLQKALADKEGYAALAHTRLGRRASRPGAELVRDAPGQALYVEAEMARRSVEQLQQMTQEATSSLRYLLQVQVQLEEDINVKMNTLKIDEVDCMTIRESMDYHEY